MSKQYAPRGRGVLSAFLAASGLTLTLPAGQASPPPQEVLQGRCDDLDSDSLAQALAVELPALLGAGAAGTAGASPRLQLGRVHMTLNEYAHSTLEPLFLLAKKGHAALCAALPRQFQFVRLAGSERGHFTAYYNPVLHGSRTRSAKYQYPLYRRPAEPDSQLTTAQILAGGLSGKGLELVYLESLGAALNVHIEGSVTVSLDDGHEINLTTDGNNGHPYTNPFKLARQAGVIPKDQLAPPGKSKSYAFFQAHPEVLRTYWEKDEHFVFFKETPLHGTGTFGELLAGRSVAVDASQVPLGVALWLRTELASAVEGDAVRYTPIARLALAQDTGAAIRGMGRIDLFVGSGEKAALAAARTSRPGELYLIVKKEKRTRRGR